VESRAFDARRRPRRQRFKFADFRIEVVDRGQRGRFHSIREAPEVSASVVTRTLAVLALSSSSAYMFKMTQTPTILERAFDLAGSGKVASLDDLRQQLKAEGFRDEGQMTGRSLTLQLAQLIAKSKKAGQPARSPGKL